jgi:hypothetical protein
LYGKLHGSFLHIEFYMNNKQRAEKKSIGDRERRLGNSWSMLEHFLSILELNIEEPGCQA